MYNLDFIVSDEFAGERIDKFVAQCSDLSRSAVGALCDSGNVRVAGVAVLKSHKLLQGQLVQVAVPKPVELQAVAQDIELDIVYEDSSLIVVNKPKGMVVHPAPGNPDQTLVNALMYHCKGKLSSINGVIRPGIVHRIDKDTSGLLLVAKTDKAHASLSEQIKEHSCERVYNAVVYGSFADEEGTVNAPIGRHPVNRKEMCVTQRLSRDAVTNYSVLARYNGFTHLKLALQTGRTHQIRVHMAHIGHPVAGDIVYGPKKIIKQLNGQCLHAKEIAFTHPETGERMQFTSELPEYFTKFLATIS